MNQSYTTEVSLMGLTFHIHNIILLCDHTRQLSQESWKSFFYVCLLSAHIGTLLHVKYHKREILDCKKSIGKTFLAIYCLENSKISKK